MLNLTDLICLLLILVMANDWIHYLTEPIYDNELKTSRKKALRISARISVLLVAYGGAALLGQFVRLLIDKFFVVHLNPQAVFDHALTLNVILLLVTAGLAIKLYMQLCDIFFDLAHTLPFSLLLLTLELVILISATAYLLPA